MLGSNDSSSSSSESLEARPGPSSAADSESSSASASFFFFVFFGTVLVSFFAFLAAMSVELSGSNFLFIPVTFGALTSTLGGAAYVYRYLISFNKPLDYMFSPTFDLKSVSNSESTACTSCAFFNKNDERLMMGEDGDRCLRPCSWVIPDS